ncbi:MAG: hypothetical protein AAFZ65_05965, partial [Planctomycetota bacterium]
RRRPPHDPLTMILAAACSLLAAVPQVQSTYQYPTVPEFDLRPCDPEVNSWDPLLAPHPAGGFWLSYGAGDLTDIWVPDSVRVQRIEASGALGYAVGDAVVVHPSFPLATGDRDVGATLGGALWLVYTRAWGGSILSYFARVEADGSLAFEPFRLWPQSGTHYHQLVALPDESAVVAFNVWNSVRLRRYAPDGNPLWDEDVVIQMPTQQFAQTAELLPSKGSTFVMSYIVDYDNAGPRVLYAQRFRPDGSPVWADGPVLVSGVGLDAEYDKRPAALPDGNGGFLTVFTTDPDKASWLQGVDSDGLLRYSDGAVKLYDYSTSEALRTRLAFDPDEDSAFVVFATLEPGESQYALRLQEVDADGSRVHGPFGVKLDLPTLHKLGGVRAAVQGQTLRIVWDSEVDGEDRVLGAVVDLETLATGGPFDISTAPGASYKFVVQACLGAFGEFVTLWREGQATQNQNNVSVSLKCWTVNGELGPPAGAMPVDAEANALPLAGAIGPIGSSASFELDLQTIGHAQAVLFASLDAAESPVAGQTLLVDLAAPELFGFPYATGPFAAWQVPLPNDVGLIGLRLRVQAAAFDPQLPLALSDGLDVYLGL